MGFTVATSIQLLFALIGLGITIYTDIENNLSMLVSAILFVLIPALGAYGTYFRKPSAILVSLFFFLFQSVRSVGGDNIVPNIMPITLSFSFGDFLNGQGYLVDFFAIFMAIFLAWLLRLSLTPTKPL